MSATSISAKNDQACDNNQSQAAQNQCSSSEKCHPSTKNADNPSTIIASKKPMYKIGCWNGAFKDTPDF